MGGQAFLMTVILALVLATASASSKLGFTFHGNVSDFRRSHSTTDSLRGVPNKKDSSPYPQHITSHGIDRVWDELGLFGQGVKIGIISTGAAIEHEALKEAYAGYLGGDSFDHNYAWLDAFGSPVPLDVRYVGSHVTGTAVGRKNYIGVAPNATFMSCRSTDDLERETPESQLKCLYFLLAPTNVYGANRRPDMRPDVIYQPYADSSFGDVLLEAILKLREAGVIVVTNAAPREERTTICAKQVRAPSFYPEVFTVGSLAKDGTLLDTSAGGPVFLENGTINFDFVKPDCVAAGADIVSSVFLEGYSLYFAASGTPISGVLTTGIFALVISANPKLRRNVRVVEELVLHGIEPIPSLECSSKSKVPNNLFGYGNMNVFRSVLRAKLYPYGACPEVPLVGVGQCRFDRTTAASLVVQQELEQEIDSNQFLEFSMQLDRGAPNLDFQNGFEDGFRLCVYDAVDDVAVQNEFYAVLSSGFQVPITPGQWSATDEGHVFQAEPSTENDGIGNCEWDNDGKITIRGEGPHLPLSRARARSYGGRFYEANPEVIVQLHALS